MSQEKVTVRSITVGECVLADVRKVRKTRALFKLSSRRANEIEKLVRFRDDVTWAKWVRPLADHLVRRSDDGGDELTAAAILHHILVIAPWFIQDRDDVQIVVENSIDDPQIWTATALGSVLELTIDERRSLHITTIRAVGQTATTMKQTKRDRDRARQDRNRREANVQRRDDWISETVAAEARRLGVSRKTIYQRRKSDRFKGNTSVASIGDLYASDEPVTLEQATDTAWLRDIASDPARREAVAHVFSLAAEILIPPKRARRAA